MKKVNLGHKDADIKFAYISIRIFIPPACHIGDSSITKNISVLPLIDCIVFISQFPSRSLCWIFTNIKFGLLTKFNDKTFQTIGTCSPKPKFYAQNLKYDVFEFSWHCTKTHQWVSAVWNNIPVSYPRIQLTWREMKVRKRWGRGRINRTE